MDQLTILRDRFTLLYRQCQDLATDMEVDATARVNAMKLTGEYSVAILKLYQESPVILMHCRELPLNMRQLQQQERQQGQQQKPQLQQKPDEEEKVVDNDEIVEEEEEEEIDDDELLEEQQQQEEDEEIEQKQLQQREQQMS